MLNAANCGNFQFKMYWIGSDFHKGWIIAMPLAASLEPIVWQSGQAKTSGIFASLS